MWICFRMGLGSILQEMIGDEQVKREVLSDEDTDIKYDDGDPDSESYFPVSSSLKTDDSINYDVKLPNSVDYFDIEEVVEDEVTNSHLCE